VVAVVVPLFIDFTYDNLGIPRNPRIAELAGGEDRGNPESHPPCCPLVRGQRAPRSTRRTPAGTGHFQHFPL